MTNTNKILLGLLGAAAAGIVVGVLMAPEKGTVVRKKIKDTANDLVDKMSDVISQGKQKLSTAAGALKHEAEGIAREVSDGVSRVHQFTE